VEKTTVAEIFDESGYAECYPPGIERHFWNIARNDMVYRWLNPVLAADDLVMDVGCGTGIVVEDLLSRGVNIRGIELGTAPIKPGLESHVQVETDLFELDETLKSQIKVILLLDVIEHMRDRTKFLQRIHRELPNCRHLLITVPSRMEIWSDYDEYWGHHLRFDRPGLEADLEAGEFPPQRTSYFFHWVYLSSLLMRALRIGKSTDFQPIEDRGIKGLLHRLLGAASCVESRVIPGCLPGSSIISIAARAADSSGRTSDTGLA
jgi:SAM-dependent methyltransferase